ncbi:hypothetical protein MSAN_02431900 [Mycena sanguinolenta]|uniref:Uncharacterized protein n=1 Tax=Mycena sanguinolenta TaxID=230812 RepID=A0A8H6X1R5_9AGAR|nr:hypothetical protein MSAN_02431900 [Mycena sanguinolenta]
MTHDATTATQTPTRCRCTRTFAPRPKRRRSTLRVPTHISLWGFDFIEDRRGKEDEGTGGAGAGTRRCTVPCLLQLLGAGREGGAAGNAASNDAAQTTCSPARPSTAPRTQLKDVISADFTRRGGLPLQGLNICLCILFPRRTLTRPLNDNPNPNAKSIAYEKARRPPPACRKARKSSPPRRPIITTYTRHVDDDGSAPCDDDFWTGISVSALVSVPPRDALAHLQAAAHHQAVDDEEAADFDCPARWAGDRRAARGRVVDVESEVDGV